MEPDLDRIADRLELAFERIPALGTAGIKNIINGPFVFSPDGNPMIGPVPGMKNYWTAVPSAGILSNASSNRSAIRSKSGSNKSCPNVCGVPSKDHGVDRGS